MVAAICIDDEARLAAVRQTGLLDGPPEDAFDRLTRLAARTLGAPGALMTLVDAGRLFFVSRSGLAAGGREAPLSHSPCSLVVRTGAPLAIEDAYARAGPVLAELGIASYAGVPLRTADGHVVGALAAIDVQPRSWSAGDLEALADLAAVAMDEIAHRQELARCRATEERLNILVSEIDHRVKNSLAVTRSLLEMQARASDEGLVRQQLEEAAARVWTIALVHDRLYGHEATGMVSLPDYLQRLCEGLATSFGIEDQVHLLNLDVEPVAVPVDRVVSLGLIVTQLVTTAMKNPAPTVAVGFCADGEDHYLLSITDAAKAVGGDEAGRSTGLGARLLTALTRQLGGEMSTSEDGAVRIRLPVDALA